MAKAFSLSRINYVNIKRISDCAANFSADVVFMPILGETSGGSVALMSQRDIDLTFNNQEEGGEDQRADCELNSSHQIIKWVSRKLNM